MNGATVGDASAVSPPLAATALAVPALVALVAQVQPEAGVPPFVVRVAMLALAGCSAYVLDDAAAQLTTVTPRGLWRRRARALGGGVALVASAWTACLLILDWRDSRPPTVVASLELTVLCLVAVATAAVLSHRGDPEPGARVAPGVVLLGVAVLIAESVLRTEVLLPWDDPGPGRGLAASWAGLGLLALVVLIAASRDPASRPVSLWVRSPRRRSNESGSA